jgi:cytoskeletal protein RodZ
MVFPDGEWKIVDGVVTEGNGGFIDLLFESPLAAIGVILLLGVIIIPIFILWFICWCIYKLVQLLVNSYRESKSIKGTSIVYPRLTHPANNNVVSLTPIVDTVESKPVSVVSKTSTTKQYYSKWDQAMDNITVPIEAPKSETVLQTQVSTVPRKEAVI